MAAARAGRGWHGAGFGSTLAGGLCIMNNASMNLGDTKRIGIMGGTFNPIHIGHLLLAQAAYERYDLAKVLFMPCSQPCHKSAPRLLAGEHRLAMVRAAIDDDHRFQASDLEVRRGGISYSVDTLKALHALHPGAEFFFIIGTDSLLELHQWKDIATLLTLCTFVTFYRPGVDHECIRPEDLKLPAPWPETLLTHLHAGRPFQVSSTEIRHRVAEGLCIRYLVPHPVEIYIAERKLYLE